MKEIINWNELFKIKIRELQDSQTKHLVVKTILVQQLLIKYKRQHNYIRIYTEFPIAEGKICDVFFSNALTKEAYAFEIQAKITPEWSKEVTKIYENWEVPFMKTSNLIVINLKELSNDIETLIKQLKELI